MKSFNQFEDEGWTTWASSFDDRFAERAGAAIDPVLESLEPLDGQCAENGCELSALTRRAIEAYGCGDVSLPAPPPGDRLAASKPVSEVLSVAGFVEPEVQDVPLVWRHRSAQAIIDAVYKSGVRAATVMQVRSAEARARIEAATLEAAGGDRKGDVIELAMPAVLVTARKP